MDCAECPFYNLNATFADGSETLSHDLIKSFPLLSPPHVEDSNHDTEATLMRQLKKHPKPPAPKPTEAPTSAPTAPTMAPTTNQTDTHSNAFHNLPSMKNAFGFQWLYVFCLSFAGVYVLYQYYKWSNRRRRIMRSEQAGNMLGDLQMLPSDDLSGHGAYQDHDDDDDHHEGYKDEDDNHKGYKDADDHHYDNDHHNGTKPIQIV